MSKIDKYITKDVLLLNFNTLQNNRDSRLYGHLIAWIPSCIKCNYVCLSPNTKSIFKVSRLVCSGNMEKVVTYALKTLAKRKVPEVFGYH